MAFGGIVGKQTTTYTDEQIQEIVNNAVSGSLKFTTGSYVGNGATTNAITLDGPLVLIYIYFTTRTSFGASQGAWTNCIFYMVNNLSIPITVNYAYNNINVINNVTVTLSDNNKTIQLYSTNARTSMNENGITYYYSAIVQ